jgi:hypothetical protein
MTEASFSRLKGIFGKRVRARREKEQLSRTICATKPLSEYPQVGLTVNPTTSGGQRRRIGSLVVPTPLVVMRTVCSFNLCFPHAKDLGM